MRPETIASMVKRTRIVAKLPSGFATLDDVHAYALEFAKRVFADKLELYPTWIMSRAKKDGGLVMETTWHNDEEKYRMVSAMASMLREFDMDSYSFVSESWLVQEKGVTEVPKNMPAPSKHPRRVECVFITTASKARSLMSLYFIKRTGWKVELIEQPEMAIDTAISGEVGGDMATLLDDDKWKVKL